MLICRQYVLTSREKDISQNWPFHEKYFQVCLKHGIIDVLPPLELLLEDKDVKHHREECVRSDSLSTEDNFGVTVGGGKMENVEGKSYTTTSKISRHKQRKDKRKRKKRSMAEIYAVAKACTLEELVNGVDKF